MRLGVLRIPPESSDCEAEGYVRSGGWAARGDGGGGGGQAEVVGGGGKLLSSIFKPRIDGHPLGPAGVSSLCWLQV